MQVMYMFFLFSSRVFSSIHLEFCWEPLLPDKKTIMAISEDMRMAAQICARSMVSPIARRDSCNWWFFFENHRFAGAERTR